ncbi:L-lactate permease [Streptomyces acidiscabies]|uniref:L-lactate permease n=1 Tax=Streptomyces acidiscabies TaxID=42234 RepID=A0AAP6BDV8_9ACTN|nr:L-lactate permease [Streptomyces acidiscabies]MBZ3917651.1 L-lactate permease [Streptomyces acidiscabies]MDX2962662.1 L-lactate permease [Streptomyces acidiscabies]MDX3019031.1 L-lactate permease [Streptomyces acidiscabies]
MYRQVLDPLAGSLYWSALLAALPLLTLFVLLGAFRVRAQFAALSALALALALAVWVWDMPSSQALSGAVEGAFYGLFPVLWILVNALWIYRMTEVTGWFAVLRRSFRTVSTDQRVQGILIAFCFGALIEALAGFGAPVAITAVMLVAVGIAPLKAATVALVANTAPVAFGSMAVPLTTLAGVTGLPLDDLGAMAGRQTPLIAVFVPLVLVFLLDGRRGVGETWPVAVVAGLTFGIAQFAASNFISVEVTDIVAGVVALVSVLGFLRVWQPARVTVGGGIDTYSDADTYGDGGTRTGPAAGKDESANGSALMAFAPYLVIVALFALTQLGPVKDWLAVHGVVTFSWPGLDVQTPAGQQAGAVTFKLEHLKAAGTILLVAGLLTMALYRLGPGRAVKAYGATLHQLRWTVVTVTSVLALAWVMNLSGQTATLGTALAQTGAAFAFFSPIVGWLGVAVTGSDTSSNSLFGVLQVTAAHETGLDPVLLAAANSTGGVLGKMLSPQNLAVAAASIGMAGSESVIFRKVLGWSLGLLAGFALIVYLQSTPVLDWMTV